eukprot:scaffold8864_cov64-Cylindrotheca_fusiformis.AAC.2
MDRLFLLVQFDKYLVDTLTSHMNVMNALMALCDFSQKTETSASTTQNSGTKRKLNDELTEKSSSIKNRDAEDAKGVVRIQGNVAHLGYWVTRIENYPFQEIGRLELSMIDGLEVWKTNDFDVSNINGLSKDGQAALKEFNTLLQTVFRERPVISSGFNNDETKKAFLKSLEKIEHFLTSKNDGTAPSLDGVLVPGIQVPEVNYAQPFIHVVMRSLGKIVDRLRATNHDEASKDSPAKTNIQTNRYLPKDDKRTARVVDKSIGANSRHVYLYRDDTVETPTEEKPDERKNCSVASLLEGAGNQIVGHLAKHVGVGFQFRGVGVDTKATGIAMTPSCMRIIQLELVGVGRPEVRLILKRSRALPFLSKANFEKRFEGSTKLSDCGELKSELYPTTEVKSEVPGGITALWNIMSCNRRALVGPSKINGEDDDEGGRIGDMISFGAYATIHRVKAPKDADEEMTEKCEDQVMKLSRYGAHFLLEHEAGILQKLSNSASQSQSASQVQRATQEGINEIIQQSIVRCVEFNKEESMTLNNVKIKLPSLVLSPRGMSSQGYIQSKCAQEAAGRVLREWSEKLSRALCHIHNQGVFHNDISPKNIMVKVDADGHYPFLIDFALASEKDEYMVGFVGTPRFTHKDIFSSKSNWASKEEYDFCGLALSLATLAGNGGYLWDSFLPSKGKDDSLLNHWVQRRGEAAWEQLDRIGLKESPWKNRCFCL